MCHFPAAVKREASVEAGDTIAFLYASGLRLSSMGSACIYHLSIEQPLEPQSRLSTFLYI